MVQVEMAVAKILAISDEKIISRTGIRNMMIPPTGPIGKEAGTE